MLTQNKNDDADDDGDEDDDDDDDSLSLFRQPSIPNIVLNTETLQ